MPRTLKDQPDPDLPLDNIKIRFRHHGGEWWATCLALDVREHHIKLSKLFNRLAYVVPEKMKKTHAFLSK